MHDDRFQETFPNVTIALRMILSMSLSAAAV